MENYACIIIDDPLLKENYGFLNYRELLALMDRHNFHTTIAFIPWNYNRTDRKIAALFRERQDRFSLCVHGCDHTEGEFARTDPNYLEVKVKLATARMIEHEKRTGLAFDRVMVFPHGKFSNEALEALRRNLYLAAINAVPEPVNGPIASEFPLFIGYKPENLDLSYDPAFIVLHHDFFKKGYERLIDFVNRINARGAKWESVGNIVRRYVSTDETNGPADISLSGLKIYSQKEYIKILMRRYVSEFRDNYLYKNDFVFNLANRVKNLIKM
jgi:peptidoglycan/xylan/chitin deacetylase (PgdA/CDA1 family)